MTRSTLIDAILHAPDLRSYTRVQEAGVDIQTYERAHRQDLKKTSQAETTKAAGAKKAVKKAAKKSVAKAAPKKAAPQKTAAKKR